MNADILRDAGIDYNYCLKRFVGRAHLLERVMNKFLQDDTMVHIRAAYGAGDLSALQSGAHELKGMCGNIGLTSLYQAADALVRMLREGDASPEALGAAYTRLCDTYEIVWRAVAASMELPS